MEILFKMDFPICITKCPFGKESKVGSQGCRECEHFVRFNTRQSIICNNSDAKVENTITEIKWRHAKAGYKFPSDAIVIPDDDRTTDRDPRLVHCAVWDSKYILIDELKKLPVDNG